jgi:hypothetical protein
LESNLNSISFPLKKSFFPIINSPLGRTNALIEVLYLLISDAITFFNSTELSLGIVGFIVVEESRILATPALDNLLRIS